MVDRIIYDRAEIEGAIAAMARRIVKADRPTTNMCLILSAAIPFGQCLHSMISPHCPNLRISYMLARRTPDERADLGWRAEVKGAWGVGERDLMGSSDQSLLLVDCIYDTGVTMEACKKKAVQCGWAPQHVLPTCLIWRQDPRCQKYPHYSGFNMQGDSIYLYGFGMDGPDGAGRDLADIYGMKKRWIGT